MLDTDDMNRIVIDIVTGNPPRILGPEADALREKLIPEIAAIIAKGGVVELIQD
jgi:hypothetical protein